MSSVRWSPGNSSWNWKSEAMGEARSNPSIERTCNIRLRLLAPAAHVKR